MVWSREENMTAGYKRHACKLRYTLGAGSDGTLRALQCHLIYNTGAYAHLGGEVMELGMEHAGGPYRIPDTLIEGTSVFTNNPVAGAMRAFGVCQATFAFESMMDMLADKIGMDPIELRLQNALKEGDINCSGTRLVTSTGIIGCLEMIKTHSSWTKREEWVSQAPPGFFRGLGLAAVFNATGYGGKVRDSAIAKIELSAEGEIVVHNSVPDMGQGNSSAFLQIASHILGQDVSRLQVKHPDTTKAYPSGSSSASRTTTTFGNALIKACEELKSRIINRAGLLMYTSSDDDLRLIPGKVIRNTDGREVTLKALAAFMPYEDRFCISHFVTPVETENIATATGFYIGFPHLIFTYGAHLARIEVERATGIIRVCDYIAATDGGSVINPVMFDQQIHGGVAQGIGYGLMEEVVMNNGIVTNKDFASYLIPGASDIPDILSYTLQGCEDNGPFGIKGVGEIAMNGPLPAISNALADACGVRIFHAPLTPGRVLDAIDGQL
jgi:CO/xanthine dehydrogenase Mo-binding subunit